MVILAVSFLMFLACVLAHVFYGRYAFLALTVACVLAVFLVAWKFSPSVDQPISVKSALFFSFLLFSWCFAYRCISISDVEWPLEKAIIFFLVVFTTLFVNLRTSRSLGITKENLKLGIVSGILVLLIYFYAYIYEKVLCVYLASGIWLPFSYRIPTDPLYLIPYMVCVGIGEESLFRGYILGTISESTGSKRKGIFLSSILFGFWHIAWAIVYIRYMTPMEATARTFHYVLDTFLWGMVIAAFYLEVGNLLAPIIVHSAWNVLADAIVAPDVSAYMSPPQQLWAGVLDFFFTILVAYVLYKAFPKLVRVLKRIL